MEEFVPLACQKCGGTQHVKAEWVQETLFKFKNKRYLLCRECKEALKEDYRKLMGWDPEMQAPLCSESGCKSFIPASPGVFPFTNHDFCRFFARNLGPAERACKKFIGGTEDAKGAVGTEVRVDTGIVWITNGSSNGTPGNRT